MTFSPYLHDRLADETGLLGRSGMIGRRVAPLNVRLTKDHKYIEWTRPDETTMPVSTSGMLDNFVRLVTADDVLKFARKYGPLLLCEHRAPFTHSWIVSDPVGISKIGSIESDTGACHFGADTDNQLFGRDEAALEAWRSEGRNTTIDGLMSVDLWQKEPVDDWFSLIRKVGSFLRLVAEVRGNNFGRWEDWQELGLEQEIEEISLASTDPAVRQVAMNNLLRDFALIWLNLSEVSLTYEWTDNNQPTVGWLTLSPWGQLGLQMIALHINSHNLMICMYCAQPFVGNKRRKPGERIVCNDQDCKKQHSRDRSFARRNRTRESNNAKA